MTYNANAIPPLKLTNKLVVRASLFLAAIFIGISLITNLLSLEVKMANNSGINLLTQLFIFFGWLFINAKKYREEELMGVASLGRIFRFCFFIILIAAVIVSIYTYLSFHFINTTLIEELKNIQLAEMEKQNMNEEQMEMTKSILDKTMTAGGLTTMAFIFFIMMGAFMSLIVGLVCRKEIATNSNNNI